jgi:hypothetical protein
LPDSSWKRFNIWIPAALPIDTKMIGRIMDTIVISYPRTAIRPMVQARLMRIVMIRAATSNILPKLMYRMATTTTRERGKSILRSRSMLFVATYPRYASPTTYISSPGAFSENAIASISLARS